MKKLIIPFFLILCAFFQAQSPTASENYIYTKTFLSADGTNKAETVQYFDGLGRPKQMVSVKATPTGKDLVVPYLYDDLGRQSREYLPVPVPTANAGIQQVSEGTVNSYYGTLFPGTTNAFTEKRTEASPLATLQAVAHPGSPWAMSGGKTQKFTQTVNKSSDQVKRYSVTNTWTSGTALSDLPAVSFFAENQLLKSVVTDEDGKVKVEFKTSDGNTVLVRQESGTERLDTYYVYNIYGHLVYVISPKGEQQISAGGNVVTQDILDKLCYQYRNDNRGRQVEKKLPGKDWEYFVYDQQNRLVASQDGNMRTGGTWLFSRYDKFDRVVYTGQFADGTTRLQAQNNANAKLLNNESRSIVPFTANTKEILYTNTAYPAGTFTALSLNYYDTYPGTNRWNLVPIPPDVLGQPVMSGDVRSTKSLSTASSVKNLEDDNWTTTHIWYDTKARPVGSLTQNHLGGFTVTERQLHFSGAVLAANTFHQRLSSDPQVAVRERFEYDSQFRLLKQYHQVNSNPEILMAEYAYNELGQVANKKVGNNLQQVDYTYNIRGWLTKINNPHQLNTDLFGYEMDFSGSSDPLVSTGNFNGNITEVTWKSAADNVLKRYIYQYDGYNRLVKGNYREPETTIPQNNYFNEQLSYDRNGNITTLQRNTKSMAGSFAEQIDNLVYNYDGNRLTSVNELAGNYQGYPDVSGNPIAYDANGSMKDQKDKGILNIDYNILDFPRNITYNQQYYIRLYVGGPVEERNVRTEYYYRADGVKLKKIYSYGRKSTETVTETEYIDGFQYETNTTIQALKFVPTSEGYYSFTDNTYIYQYKDHLGNVRVSYSNQNGSAVILEEESYYPYGLRHENNLSLNPYHYKYNGKELQTDSGMYDYGARFYMPELGRWGVVDPLSEMTRRFSPYVYGNSNPMRFTDPDGRHSIDNLQGGYTSGSTVASFLGSFSGDFTGFMPSYFADEQGEVYANRSSSYEGGGIGSGGFSWKAYVATMLQIYNLDLLASTGGGDDLLSWLNKKKNEIGKWRSNVREAGRLTMEWALGTGAEYNVFIDEDVANSMRDAPQVDEARNFWYKKAKKENSFGVDVTNYKGKFGLSELIGSGFNPIQQFVGSMRIDIFSNGQNLTFIITNTTSFKSLMYGIAPDWSRNFMRAGGNTLNIYIWSEIIKK